MGRFCIECMSSLGIRDCVIIMVERMVGLGLVGRRCVF